MECRKGLRMRVSNLIVVGLLMLLAAVGCRPKEAVADEQLPAVVEEQLPPVDLSIMWINNYGRPILILKIDGELLHIRTTTITSNPVAYSHKLDSMECSDIYKMVQAAGSALHDTVVPCSDPNGWEYKIVNRGYAADIVPSMSLQSFVDSILAVSKFSPRFDRRGLVQSDSKYTPTDTLISVRWWSATDCNGRGAEHNMSIVRDTLRYLSEDIEYVEPVEPAFKVRLLNLLGKAGSKSRTVAIYPYGSDNWEVSITSPGVALANSSAQKSIADRLIKIIDKNLPMHPEYYLPKLDSEDDAKYNRGVCRRTPCPGAREYRNTKNTWNKIEFYISHLHDNDFSAAKKITINDGTITFKDGNTKRSRALSDRELTNLNSLLQRINVNGTYLYDFGPGLMGEFSTSKLEVDGKVLYMVNPVTFQIDGYYDIYDYIKSISPVSINNID